MSVGSSDCVGQWMDTVRQAAARRQRLALYAGQTKAFLAGQQGGTGLNLGAYSGLVDYQPTELVITVRNGTPVTELQQLLAEHGQYFPCEPPEFDGRATVGGMVASGWAGARRPWSGSIRDYVLGCRLISGTGEHLRFGGQVMKNVAGYDVSRLMAGSFGCLGILTEVSLKVLPRPRGNASQVLDLPCARFLDGLKDWGRQGLPLAGAFHDGHLGYVRLEGGEAAVALASKKIGGTAVDDQPWRDLAGQKLPFFAGPGVLWRLSVPMGTNLPDWPGAALMDWAGAQWWLKVPAQTTPDCVQAIARQAGGYAVCHEQQPVKGRWPLLEAGLLELNHRVKAQLDPHQVFNQGIWETEC